MNMMRGVFGVQLEACMQSSMLRAAPEMDAVLESPYRALDPVTKMLLVIDRPDATYPRRPAVQDAEAYG